MDELPDVDEFRIGTIPPVVIDARWVVLLEELGSGLKRQGKKTPRQLPGGGKGDDPSWGVAGVKISSDRAVAYTVFTVF
jgi:hypothetical protein